MLNKIFAKLFGAGLLSQAIGALVRHLLTALSGILLGLGIDGALVTSWISLTQQISIALVGLLVAYILSLVNKLD